jgi:hypothetical protein
MKLLPRMKKYAFGISTYQMLQLYAVKCIYSILCTCHIGIYGNLVPLMSLFSELGTNSEICNFVIVGKDC